MNLTQATVVWLAIMAVPTVGAAQDVPASLDELSNANTVGPGDRVYVMDTEGRRIRGYIIELSTAAVSLTDGRVTWTMTDAEVGRIERADPLTNGMWIGAGLTFAATMAYCKLVEEPRTGSCYATSYTWPISFGVGIGVGALVDASLHEKLYEAGWSADVQLSPVVTRRGVGARLSVGW